MASPSLSSSQNGEEGLVTTAIAIDNDRNSQFAVRWAVENLLEKDSTVILVHVRIQSFQSKDSAPRGGRSPTDTEMKQFFLPYRGYCARKGVRAVEVVLHDVDISRGLVDLIRRSSISTIVLGASNRTALARAFRNPDVPTSLCKIVPDFCTVYVISRGKVQHAKVPVKGSSALASKRSSQTGFSADGNQYDDSYRGPTSGSRKGGSSERMSFEMNSELNRPTSLSTGQSIGLGVSSPPDSRSNLNLPVLKKGSSTVRDSNAEMNDYPGSPGVLSTEFSDESFDNSRISDISRSSVPSQVSREVETEMRRLKLELKQTMDMYNSACKEAVGAKEKAKEIDQWKTEEARKLEAAMQAQMAALACIEMEKQKTKAALEMAQMAQRLAELEVQKRKNAEMKAIKEAEERKKAMDSLACSEIRYRKYTIEDIKTVTGNFSSSFKIGEGGYGPVYKAFLDHTAVAIKVLKADMSEGKTQFQREVEVLSYIRHPNMVLLLGACPDSGCLVYEYMENGTLEDRIFRKNNTPPLPWQMRFRIAAEIATGLLFLHQTKPEPLVHRDLKPANILLDRNFVSKISDVGLAQLVPPSVADSVTQYRLTAAAGTFCYIDPEYQQSGLLGVKSDIYSFGIILLQIITGRPPMALAHHVENAIEKGTLSEILDPTVDDWPFEEVLSFAKLALQCCELRKKDRPDLSSVILPELQRLSDLGSDDEATNCGRITTGVSFSYSSFKVRPEFSQEAGKTNGGRRASDIKCRSTLKEGSGSGRPSAELTRQ
ncbi:U-box domain-containing protein 35-like isoform X1 [Diospyros lotus]|uniref:U-box domain-containing protein 35-like isoform X1 n=1 Tax=Diospyros lotus TaxID=55363 RepID=UPI0022543935|nr:U-box domain-containing protein 35-like isoform X1 [Diospyros lotus]